VQQKSQPFLAEDAQAADDQRMPIGHRHLGLSQKPPHEAHALLPADVVTVMPEDIIGQNRSVATQHDLGIRRVFPDESDDLLHAMEGRQNERHADVVVAPLQLADELLPVRILQDGRRRLQVLGDVLE
jgi:hypothetical protein